MPNQRQHIAVTASDDSATTLGTITSTVTQALLRCEDNPLRWRADGTSPTASVGTRMDPGDVLVLSGNDYNDFLKNFEFINLTAGSNSSLEGAGLDGFDRA
jgi:hypothetical protein